MNCSFLHIYFINSQATVRAMDTIQDYARTEDIEVERFFLSGPSKVLQKAYFV